MKKRPVYQFKIILKGIEPVIWRRIQISDLATFWDLHIAIQSTMAWLDYHLHQFIIYNPKTFKFNTIGIPDDEFHEILPTKPGWELKIRDYFSSTNAVCEYEYDFGDSWKHNIEFEGEFEKISGQKYPICLGGENACPPEDVGSCAGYSKFVKIMSNKKHPEYDFYHDWYGGEFDPKEFDIKKIKFLNSKASITSLLNDYYEHQI